MATVFVSGASRGLGKSLVEVFRAEGHRTFGGMRVPQGDGSIALNVREVPSCDAAVRQVVDAAGGIDILVNNAGVYLGGPVAELDQDAFKETLDVNLLGAWRLTKATLPHMRRGGTIAMISSLSGLVGLPDDGAYAASKFALEGLSQSLATELAPLGIRVLMFEPGRIMTGFAGVTSGTSPDEAGREISDAIMSGSTHFRTPIGADAVAYFRQLEVDRGPGLASVIEAVTGKSWNENIVGGTGMPKQGGA